MYPDETFIGGQAVLTLFFLYWVWRHPISLGEALCFRLYGVPKYVQILMGIVTWGGYFSGIGLLITLTEYL